MVFDLSIKLGDGMRTGVDLAVALETAAAELRQHEAVITDRDAVQLTIVVDGNLDAVGSWSIHA